MVQELRTRMAETLELRSPAEVDRVLHHVASGLGPAQLCAISPKRPGLRGRPLSVRGQRPMRSWLVTTSPRNRTTAWSCGSLAAVGIRTWTPMPGRIRASPRRPGAGGSMDFEPVVRTPVRLLGDLGPAGFHRATAPVRRRGTRR
jgi:hypothetical protein